jgi:hypothetical protein
MTKSIATSKLKYINGSEIFKAICTQARVLPYNAHLEYVITPIYKQAIENNVYNLYRNSPSFYAQHIKPNAEGFVNYQMFIYLMVFIDHVYHNRHSEDKELYPEEVVGWAMKRYNSDTQYYITGPTSQTNYRVEFKQIYISLISPSNTMETISDYLQLMSIENVASNINEVDNRLRMRDNAYDKLNNENQCFRMSVVANGVEDNNRMFFEFSFNGNTKDANIEHHINDDIGKDAEVIPKTDLQKFTAVLRSYNTISVDSLLINKFAYQTPLDAFDKVYLVFSDIIGEALTNIEVDQHSVSSFTIPGKFVLNTTHYEFVPDHPICYKSKSVNVKKLRFTLMVRDGNLYYNSPRLTLERAYNVVIGDTSSRIIKYYLVERIGVEHDYTWRTDSNQRNKLEYIVMYDKGSNLIFYNNKYYVPAVSDVNKGGWSLEQLVNTDINNGLMATVVQSKLISETQRQLFQDAYNDTKSTYVNYLENKPLGLIFDSEADYLTLNSKPVLKINDTQSKVVMKSTPKLPIILVNDACDVKLTLSLK